MHCAEKHSALCNLRTRYHTMCSDQCGVQLYYVVQWSVCSKQSRYLWNTKILFHVFNKELSTIVQTKVTAMKCKTAQCNKMLRSAVQCSKRLCNAYQWSEVHLDQNWAKSRHLLFKTFELLMLWILGSRIVHCLFSNGFLHCLPEKRQSHISCICLTFLHCEFSYVFSNGLPKRM